MSLDPLKKSMIFPIASPFSLSFNMHIDQVSGDYYQISFSLLFYLHVSFLINCLFIVTLA